jgi:hypothetical protein
MMKIFWHGTERTGLFTIWTAYKLAPEGEQAEVRQASSSSHQMEPNRYTRKYGRQRFEFFAWKLAQEGLATNSNRKRHHLTQDATCQICGREAEIDFHAAIRCTKARALHQELRQPYNLPDEQ